MKRGVSSFSWIWSLIIFRTDCWNFFDSLCVSLPSVFSKELIAELKRLHRQGKDIGQYIYLRRYERSRKHSAALMLAGMQGFRDLFSGTNPAKKLLRDIGLKLADTLPGVKPQLIRQAMGLNDLPEWLR